MKSLLTTVFLMVSLVSFSQTTYYEYNKAGVPIKVGYSTPTPNPVQFAPYVPPISVQQYEKTSQAYIEGAKIRQAQYDKNTASLKNLIEASWYLINRIPDANLKKTYTDMLTSITNIMSGKNYDWANPQTYDYWYNNIYKDVYSPLKN